MLRFFFFLLIVLSSPVRAGEVELSVPLRTVYPGESMSSVPTELRLFELRADQMTLFARSVESIAGRVARRTLLANQPIPLQAIEEPRVALVGRQVRLDYVEGGLQISTFGSVLQNGGVGDLISVRVLDGGRVVSGIVQKDGSVRVREGAS